MATPAASLTRSYGVSQAKVSARVAAQSLIAFRNLLDPSALDKSFPRYLATQHLLIGAGRRDAAQLAGAYYETHRHASGVKGRVQVRNAPAVTVDRTAASLLYTGPVKVKQRLAKGATIEQALADAESTTLGAIFRMVADGGRDTISRTLDGDPQALGYARVTDGDPCAFCAMLASRGFVYKDEGTADGEYHDRCGCFAQPMYSTDDEVPGRGQEFSDLWAETTGDFTGSGKAKAFRRAYEAQSR